MNDLISESIVTFIKTYAVAFFSISFVVLVLQIVAMWKLFKKAGEPGWKAIIPIYNSYVYYKISGVPSLFWILIVVSVLSAVPNDIVVYISLILTICIVVYQTHSLSKAFGHGVGYTLGLLFLNLIFVFILGFGSSEYKLEKK